MSQLKQLTAVVYGTVQGVSFRYYTQQMARRLGVAGWVVNQRNGTVKTVAEGDEATLQEFLAFLHEGSPAARVQRVDATWSEATGAFSTFSVRFRDV
ncbi:MAG: acylphosphatase [Anaerolineaceae bacterium]|nr:acylphosphatase [Anaerolineaceae bacterium]